jgi:DNA-binding NtrC family response regulator
MIDLTQIRQVLHPGLQGGAEPETESRQSLRDLEKACIHEALRQTRGNKTAAAALLGISLRGLHYKLNRLGQQKARKVVSPKPPPCGDPGNGSGSDRVPLPLTQM